MYATIVRHTTLILIFGYTPKLFEHARLVSSHDGVHNHELRFTVNIVEHDSNISCVKINVGFYIYSGIYLLRITIIGNVLHFKIRLFFYKLVPRQIYCIYRDIFLIL